jgi:hypothetical protein
MDPDRNSDSDPDADPDPSIFITDFQDANEKLIKKSFPVYYFFKVLNSYTSFSKIKSQKKMSQNSRNQGFSHFICLLIEGSASVSRAGSGSRYIPPTNRSGSETLPETSTKNAVQEFHLRTTMWYYLWQPSPPAPDLLPPPAPSPLCRSSSFLALQARYLHTKTPYLQLKEGSDALSLAKSHYLYLKFRAGQS